MNEVGMAPGGRVSVHPYDAAWPLEFERVAEELRSAVPAWVGPIFHVGSTSVQDLDAKPIIDLLVGVPSLTKGLDLVPTLEALGFEYSPNDELPDRHYFPRTVEGLRLHHVSVAEPSSRHFRNSLIFRDALRNAPDLAQRYAALKHQLAREVGTERLAYLNGKTDFILSVLRRHGGEVDGDYPIRNLGSSAV